MIRLEWCAKDQRRGEWRNGFLKLTDFCWRIFRKRIRVNALRNTSTKKSMKLARILSPDSSAEWRTECLSVNPLLNSIQNRSPSRVPQDSGKKSQEGSKYASKETCTGLCRTLAYRGSILYTLDLFLGWMRFHEKKTWKKSVVITIPTTNTSSY